MKFLTLAIDEVCVYTERGKKRGGGIRLTLKNNLNGGERAGKCVQGDIRSQSLTFQTGCTDFIAPILFI